MKELKCLRCQKPMNFAGNKKIQMGETGWILGDLPNLLAGSLEVDIYICPGCGKIEFYSDDSATEGLPLKKCPNCGAQHEFDYPKCPVCKFDYYK